MRRATLRITDSLMLASSAHLGRLERRSQRPLVAYLDFPVYSPTDTSPDPAFAGRAEGSGQFERPTSI